MDTKAWSLRSSTLLHGLVGRSGLLLKSTNFFASPGRRGSAGRSERALTLSPDGRALLVCLYIASLSAPEHFTVYVLSMVLVA